MIRQKFKRYCGGKQMRVIRELVSFVRVYSAGWLNTQTGGTV